MLNQENKRGKYGEEKAQEFESLREAPAGLENREQS